MKDIKEMTNGEFMEHLVTGYNKHGALVQMVVLDCLQKGLDNYLENKEVILEQAAKDRTLGDLRALAGVSKFPVRVKCALLGFDALQEALKQTGDGEGH